MPACPTCGKDLTYIADYDRYYCYAEGTYAPKGFGAPVAPTPPAAAAPASEGMEGHDGHYHCPSCGKELTYIGRYDRYWCQDEQKYAPRGIQPIRAAPVAAVQPEPTPAIVTPPVTEAPRVEPAPVAQPEPVPEAKPVTETPPVVPAAEPVVAPVAAEPAPAAAPATPAITRDEVSAAKKSQLVDWARQLGLDGHGNKETLRDRILLYLDEHAAPEEEEEEAPAEEELGAQEVPPAAEPATPTQPEPPPQPATQPAPEVLPPETPPVIVPPEPQPAPAPIPPPAPAAAAIPEPPKVQALPTPPPVVPAPAPAPAPAPEPTMEVKVAKPLPCPNCGKDLTYLAKYDRLYCYSCGKYAPKGYGQEPPPEAAAPPTIVEVPKAAALEAPRPAPVVEAPRPAPVAEAPKPVAAPIAVAPVVAPRAEARAAHPCPTCGRELRYVKDYDRWWCDHDRKYAPKVRYPCPTCGKELTYVPQYDRYYCYAEGTYAPKDYQPSAAARAVAAAPGVTQEALAAVEARVAAIEKARHAHGKPWAGVALAIAGFSLLIVQLLFTTLLPLLGVIQLPTDPAALLEVLKIMTILQFVGLLLAMIGVIVGLAMVRRRQG